MVWACRNETVNISVEGWRGWKWQASWRKTTREIYRGSERGCGVSWCKRRGCRGWGEIEADGWLWPPLKGTSWRNRRKILKCHNNDLFCKWEHLPQYLGCIFLKGQAAIFRCSWAQYVKRGKGKLEPHLVVLLSRLPLCPLPSLVCISTNTNADQGRCGRIMLQACECQVKELDIVTFTSIMLDITLKPSVSRTITMSCYQGDHYQWRTCL